MNKKVEPQDRKILLSETVELGEKTNKGQIVTDPNVLFNEMEREASFLTGSEVIRAAIKRANLDVYHHRRSGNPACDGKFSHVGRITSSDSSVRDLPGYQFSPEYSAGHPGNVLPVGNGDAGLAC